MATAMAQKSWDILVNEPTDEHGHTVLFLICAVHIYNIPLSDTALQCFGAIFPCGQKPIKVSSKGSFIAAPNLIYLNSFSQTSKLILTLQLMI